MGETEKTGKDRASDLREGKKTLIAIIAKEKGIDLSKYRKDSLTDEEIQEAIDILSNAGVIEEARNTAMEHVGKAKQMLTVFPECEESINRGF
jgi:geranylgeranyl diphosphate synthase type I